MVGSNRMCRTDASALLRPDEARGEGTLLSASLGSHTLMLDTTTKTAGTGPRLHELTGREAARSVHVQPDGKFFILDGHPFRVRGATYGTFTPRADGELFPDVA